MCIIFSFYQYNNIVTKRARNRYELELEWCERESRPTYPTHNIIYHNLKL